MTTQPRPTAEEIAALFAKHGVKPQIGVIFGQTLEGEPTACALGVLALDRCGPWLGGPIIHTHAYNRLYAMFGEVECDGLSDGFDGTTCLRRYWERRGQEARYAEGYATGQAVRRLVGLEAGA